MKKFIISTILIISVAWGCDSTATKEEETDTSEILKLNKAQIKLAGIEIGPLAEQEIEMYVNARGVIDAPPENLATLSTPFGGYISYIKIYPGEKVSKGQLLAKITDPVYVQMQQEYLSLLSNLQFLEKDFERKNSLRTTESVSEKTLQEAQRDLNMTRAAVTGAEANLKLAGISAQNVLKTGVQAEVEVRSPINGYVTHVNANLGKYLQAGDVILEIVDPNHLHIELSVYNTDLPKIEAKQKIYFRLSGQTEEKTGYVKLINKAVNEETRSVLVHAHPDNEDDETLLVGTFVEARIIYNTVKIKALPLDGVVKGEYGFTAFRQIDNGFEPINFTGRIINGYWIEAPSLPDGTYVMKNAVKMLEVEAEE